MQEETMKNDAELRLEEAQRLLEEEEKGKAKPEVVEGEEVITPEAEPEEEQEEAEEPKRKEKDPKVDAIVALRKQNQLLTEKLRFQEGQIEAMAKMKTAPQKIQEQKSRLEEIEEELDAIAEKADAGEISLAEERRFARKLEDERFELKMQERMAKVAPKQEQQMEDSYKAQKTAELLEGKDYLNDLEPEDWQLINRKVMKAAKDDPLPNGPLGDLELRRRMVELADKLYGPEPKAEPKADESNDEKVKAYAKKQELQERHPADVRKMGSGGNTETMSLEAIEAKIFRMKDPMEADEFVRTLSPATRKKLGI